VERWMTIPAVGPITALSWALEVGDVQRFSSIKKAISYCGLCGAEKSRKKVFDRANMVRDVRSACSPGLESDTWEPPSRKS
jgi:transposase